MDWMAAMRFKLLHLSQLRGLRESEGYQTLMLTLYPSVRETSMLDPVFMLCLILFREHLFLSN
jgi:hypothetical protein